MMAKVKNKRTGAVRYIAKPDDYPLETGEDIRLFPRGDNDLWEVLSIKRKNIYVICPVRNGTPGDVSAYVSGLEKDGIIVHFPPRDAPQDDPTGETICSIHLAALRKADEVHVFWDVNSRGSHFDLGMAYALRKPLIMIKSYQADGSGKSYEKVIRASR